MIKLYWHPRTRAVRTHWLLEEIGAPYEIVPIDITNEKAKSDPAFRAASPLGKVPALEDGEVKLWDSAPIALYLADRFPDAGLAPALGDPLRAQYYYWMVFTPGVIEPAMGEKFNKWTPDRHRHGWGDFDSMVELLEKGVAEGPWILGDRFSAADVLIGSSVFFLINFGAVKDNKTLDAYLERCLARPAYQRAMARNEESAA